jgi:hypothetical protein
VPTIVTLEAFTTWARDTITADTSTKLDALNAAERWVCNETGRNWILVTGSTAATARVFRPERCTQVLFIDDAATITSVAENGTTLTAGVDYQAEPLNGLTPSGESCSYDRLIRLDAEWYTDNLRATVAVTAKWGQVSIPYEVEQAVLYQAKAMLQGRDYVGAVLAATEAGAITERTAKVIMDMRSHYRGHKSWGIA